MSVAAHSKANTPTMTSLLLSTHRPRGVTFSLAVNETKFLSIHAGKGTCSEVVAKDDLAVRTFQPCKANLSSALEEVRNVE